MRTSGKIVTSPLLTRHISSHTNRSAFALIIVLPCARSAESRSASA
ncbi:hypothetical protein [Nonomuraea sp. GTA35]